MKRTNKGAFSVKALPLAVSLLAANAMVANTALAQDGDIEEVVITGSYIKGTGTDEASPVDVLNSDYIQKQGALTIGELTQKLAVSSGTENNPDSFTAGSTQGTSNVNLRGLGLTSTLVLVNGKRQTIAAAIANDGSVFVDTATIPMAALERVEILKEGATATYGSDAVAGVVNFILRDDFDGVEVSLGHQTTATSSQDTSDVSILAGTNLSDNTNVMVAASFLQQDAMSSAERSYTTINAVSTLGRSFLNLGGLAPGLPVVIEGSGGYAGPYGPGETIPDANCEANGGILSGGFIPSLGGQKCGFLYGPRFNLVNEEERTNVYAAITHDTDSGITVRGEIGFAKNEVLDNPQSPSYPNLSFPTIAPGQAGSPFNGFVRWYGRPLGSEAPSPLAPRNSETLRASLDLSGTLDGGAWDWNASVTYSENDREGWQPDTIKSRLDAALAGAGGESGTETFNIFDPSQNSASLIDYISAETYTKMSTDLTVADLVVSGPWFELDDFGTVNLAYGAQFRHEGFSIARNDISTQQRDSVTGALQDVDLIFLGGGTEPSASRDSFAAFAEVSMPLNDSVELNVAARYESLETESSLDPKIALRWQVSDDVVIRGSMSTAFREASLIQQFNRQTSLQGLVDTSVGGSSGTLFIRVLTEGDVELKPETSTNTNLGVVWTPSDNFNMRVDWWQFEYEDVITIENAQGKINADPNRQDPDVRRSDAGQLIGVSTNFINAATVDTDGFDVSADWNLPAGDAGDFGVQLAYSRFNSYEIPDGNGGTRDVVGSFNHDNFVRSMPEAKWNLTADWERGNHSAAVVLYHVDSYTTSRAVPASAAAMGFDSNIDSWRTIDASYNYNFNIGDTQGVLTLGGKNLTDEEAPRVYDAANFSYDPKQHDPRGRIYYARVKFAL
ncbi:outer membrane cobalamin receptor protein [gamma proteobacterium HIMB55]|nr:outer membrane cobalamin receptor protein [gamma proteobacterium HIMB55]